MDINPLKVYRPFLFLVPTSFLLFRIFSVSYFYLGYVFIGLSLILVVSSFMGKRPWYDFLIHLLFMFSGLLLLSEVIMPFLYYPVVASLVVSVFFICNYKFHPCIIESIAIRLEPDLPIEALKYCRKVQLVWICFMICNTLISFYTVLYGSFDQWLWYNGFLSYLLMAIIFLGEYLVRLRFRGRLRGKSTYAS
ncbi:MAG TPA: hypothetical protein PKA63_14435 [Oligoflexia bacterium]|nr:hypothetical protein [Oligoflexia bacterium]HMP49863.1 hypothetical protein [Oligoflexia bacterium]